MICYKKWTHKKLREVLMLGTLGSLFVLNFNALRPLFQWSHKCKDIHEISQILTIKIYIIYNKMLFPCFANYKKLSFNNIH